MLLIVQDVLDVIDITGEVDGTATAFHLLCDTVSVGAGSIGCPGDCPAAWVTVTVRATPSAVQIVTVACLWVVVLGLADVVLSVKCILPKPLVLDGASHGWLLLINQLVFEFIVLLGEVTAPDPAFHVVGDTVSVDDIAA